MAGESSMSDGLYETGPVASGETNRPNSVGFLIARLAATNVELWHEEDKARVSDDHRVAAAKRQIDRLNQQRNDLVERIDSEVMRLVRQGAGEQGRG
jgi:hypothetical protein